MPALNRENAEALLHRFCRFNDGVIREVTLTLAQHAGHSTAKVAVLARDAESESDGRWGVVTFSLTGLSEYHLEEAQASFQVLSDGLNLGWFDGLVFLDFGPYTDEPEGVEDYRRSGFYLAGTACDWCVEAGPLLPGMRLG